MGQAVSFRTDAYPHCVFTLADDALTLSAYTGAEQQIDVPAEVDGRPLTAIGDGAFKNNRTLWNISLPDSITSIGEEAFYGCGSLNGIKLPQGLVSLGDRAFADCTSLYSIVLPQGITWLGAGLFADSSLNTITLPDGITGYSAEQDPFQNCNISTMIYRPGTATAATMDREFFAPEFPQYRLSQWGTGAVSYTHLDVYKRQGGFCKIL